MEMFMALNGFQRTNNWNELKQTTSGWWLGHPSEKYESQMIIPNIWENKNCSKPPTRHASEPSKTTFDWEELVHHGYCRS